MRATQRTQSVSSAMHTCGKAQQSVTAVRGISDFSTLRTLRP